jgi:hypothetical protein
MKLPLNAKMGDLVIYISKSEELMKKAFEYDMKDPKKFGKLLGYPNCCVDEFISNNNSELNIYPYKNTIEKNKKIPFYLNHCPSNFRLISHFPCSYDCIPSLSMAEETFNIINSILPELAKEIKNFLKFPILYWNELKGIVFDGYVIKNEIIYKKIFYLNKKKILPKFMNGNKIFVSKSEIRIYKDDLIIDRIKKKNEFDGILLNFS